LFEEALELVQREEPGRKRVVEAIELLPEVLRAGRGAAGGEASRAVAERAHAGRDGAAPLIEIHADEVRALEGEVVVGRVDERAVKALHLDAASQGRGDDGSARSADVDVEALGL